MGCSVCSVVAAAEGSVTLLSLLPCSVSGRLAYFLQTADLSRLVLSLAPPFLF